MRPAESPNNRPLLLPPPEPGTGDRVPIEAGCLVDAIRPLAETLASRVVGQESAVETLICSCSRLLSGLRDPRRPLLTALLLGPTGVGKTETARALAQGLFGSENALTRINCEEYAHGHELSKMLGSPPAYVGSEIEPLLSQRRIDFHHRNARPAAAAGVATLADRLVGFREDRHVSVILFDEIEKAHPTVWSALLGLLEDGRMTLGNNDTTDFSHSIILMTSNVGSREMGALLEHRPIGFRSPEEESAASREMEPVALEAARKVFPLEFLNRFDETLVYSPLASAHLDEILEKFLADLHQRAMTQARLPLLIRVSPEARRLIVALGTDIRFGARPLRRAFERELVDPLSRLIASGALQAGDIVEVEANPQLVFYRRQRTLRTALVT